MSKQNEFFLMEHLDKTLSPEEAAQAEILLKSNRQAATEWEYLKLAVEAVKLGAIREQVLEVSGSLNAHKASVMQSSPAVVRKMYRTGLRIAAVLILLLGISMVYKYSTVTNNSLYKAYFTDYTLSTSRGENAQNALDDAFRNRNWNGVTAAFNQESDKTNKSYFLAGMAAMELHQYPEAVSRFEHILIANAKSGDRYYQDETEYYLALAYLMNQQTGKGIALMTEIRENKNQQYYPLASRISSTDLKIIKLKNGK